MSRVSALVLALLFAHCNAALLRKALLQRSSKSLRSGAAFRLGTGMRLASKTEVMATMTVEKAYRTLMAMRMKMTTNTNKSLLDMIQNRLRGGGQSSLVPAGYAAVDSARDMLNGMMSEAEMKKELENVRCSEFGHSQMASLKELENDVSYVNSEASAARAGVLQATEVIQVVEQVKLPNNNEELTEHHRRCTLDIATMKQQLAIVTGDIEVMKNINDMVCASDVSNVVTLLQLGSTTSTGAMAIVKCVSCLTGQNTAFLRHSTLQPMLAGLRSEMARGYYEENMLGEFDASARRTPSNGRTVSLMEEEARHVSKNIPGLVIQGLPNTPQLNPRTGPCNEQMTGDRGTTYRGCQTKTVSGYTCQPWSLQTPHAHTRTPDNYPDAGLGDHNYCRNPDNSESIWCFTTDPSKDWEFCEPLIGLDAPTGISQHTCVETNACKLSTPNCQKLQDRFLVILAGLEDKRDELTNEISSMEENCDMTTKQYNDIISNLQIRLKEEQTNLASATKTMTDNQEQSRLSNLQHRDMTTDYHATLTQCCDNKNQLTSEICALERIRGELYKLEGLQEFITDCVVTDWVDHECSASCGGGLQDMTRSILVHPINGTACPPLNMERSCNKVGCPEDCEVGEWGGWSDCTAECGGGVMTRTRSKRREPVWGGEICPSLTDTTQCNNFACDADCVLNEWNTWGVCSRMCGGGHQERTRTVQTEERGMGLCPQPMSEERIGKQTCNPFDCRLLLPTGRTVLRCTAMLDVIIVLDGSGSLGSYGWEKSKNMTRQLVQSMIGGPNGVNLGLLLFSGPANTQNYQACTSGAEDSTLTPEDCGMHWVKRMTGDMQDVEQALAAKQWPGRTTLTSMALAQAGAELIDGRQDANSVVVVITDAKPMSPRRTGHAAEELKRKARLVWVPVEQGEISDQMKSWASYPWEDNILEISSFSILESSRVLNSLVSELCPQVK